MKRYREFLKQAIDIVNKSGQGKLTMGESLSFIEKAEKELAKPDPDPIAWIQANETGALSLRWTKPPENKIENALYTFPPPQSKPLSEKEIWNIFKDILFDSPLIDKVRVVEKAHGIGK